jgi:aldehyde:ferredoxin oxidoreductase
MAGAAGFSKWILPTAAFETMRAEFYTLRGWDTASGCQRRSHLAALDLGDVADAMTALGYLAN